MLQNIPLLLSHPCLCAGRFDGYKTPTVDIAPVKLYPYVKSKTQTQMHEFASCFCPYRLYPHDTLCTYGAKQLKLLGFSQRHLFWCSLMVDLKRLELSTSRMRTERSPEWFRYMHPKFLENRKNIGILRKPSDMSFLYKGTFSAAPQQGKVSFVLRS